MVVLACTERTEERTETRFFERMADVGTASQAWRGQMLNSANQHKAMGIDILHVGG
jgi:hypothetical protein